MTDMTEQSETPYRDIENACAVLKAIVHWAVDHPSDLRSPGDAIQLAVEALRCARDFMDNCDRDEQDDKFIDHDETEETP